MTERSRPRTSRRVTPKGTTPGRAAPASGRYTPPIPRSQKVSPRWVPVLMFTFLLAGFALIVLNYFDVLPTLPGDDDGVSNLYLFGGMGLIGAGFATATQYH